MTRRAGLLFLLILCACAKAPPLERSEAIRLIRSSPAFATPIDPGIVFVDASFRPGPSTRRELLRLEGIDAKDDGPLAMAGRTATVVFTWRWTEGPFANRVFRSSARLHGSADGWKVYDDQLKHALWSSERGEED